MSAKQKEKQPRPTVNAKEKFRGVLFMEGIPEDTKSAFKAACARKRRTMRDEVIKFMQEYAEAVR